MYCTWRWPIIKWYVIYIWKRWWNMQKLALCRQNEKTWDINVQIYKSKFHIYLDIIVTILITFRHDIWQYNLYINIHKICTLLAEYLMTFCRKHMTLISQVLLNLNESAQVIHNIHNMGALQLTIFMGVFWVTLYIKGNWHSLYIAHI